MVFVTHEVISAIFVTRDITLYFTVVSDEEKLIPSCLLPKHFPREKKRAAEYKYINLDNFSEKIFENKSFHKNCKLLDLQKELLWLHRFL